MTMPKLRPPNVVAGDQQWDGTTEEGRTVEAEGNGVQGAAMCGKGARLMNFRYTDDTAPETCQNLPRF